jgi:hypothetical protein
MVVTRSRLEPVLAAVAALVGIALTTIGAFAHVAWLSAPGATLILVGGAWLGNALARHGVRLFSADRPKQIGQGD